MYIHHFIICFLFVPAFFPVSPFLLPCSYLSHFNSISFCRVSSPFWFPAVQCALSPEVRGCTRLRLSHLQNQSGRKPRSCPCFSKARRPRPILEEELQDLLGPPSAPERRQLPTCTGFRPGDPEGHTASGRELALSRPSSESWLPSPGCLRTRTSRVFRWAPGTVLGF